MMGFRVKLIVFILFHWGLSSSLSSELPPDSVQPFTGDVGTSTGLLDALKARSFKQELVLVTDYRQDAVWQVFSQLTKVGIHHVLWLAPDKDRCLRSAKLLPGLGCAWSSQPLPQGFVGPRKMALRKLMLLARIARLAHNVLSLDGDAFVLRDPYPFLKQGPLADTHLLALRGARQGTPSTAMLYVQNASKRGPVAWALAEAALRNLRWGDADINLPSNAQTRGVGNTGFATGCDASLLLTDVVISGVARKPCHWFCFRPVSAGTAQGGSTVGEWDRLHLAQLGLGESGLKDLYKRDIVRLKAKTDPDMVTLVTASSYSIQWVSLSIPPSLDSALVPIPEAAQAALRQSASQADGEGGAGAQAQGAAGANTAGAEGGKGTMDDSPTAAAFKALMKSDKVELRLRMRRSRAAARRLQRSQGEAPSRQADTDADVNAESVSDSDVEASGSSNSTSWPQSGAGLPKELGSRKLTQGSASWSTKPGQIEKFALAPDWLFGSWAVRGIFGFWDPAMAGSPPRQVIGNLARVPGLGPGREAVRIAFGTFNWTLASLLPNGLATTVIAGLNQDAAGKTAGSLLNKGGAEGVAGVGSKLPRMVALDPGSLVMRQAHTREEWSGVLRGLAKVAALSGRMMVWPDVNCSSPWISPQPVSPARKLPLRMNPHVLAYGPLASARCVTAEVLTPRCLYDRTLGDARQWWQANQASTAEGVVAGGWYRHQAGGATQQRRRRSKAAAKDRGTSLRGVVRGLKQGYGEEDLPDDSSVIRGMLSLEFDHLATLLPEDFKAPWAINTLQLRPETASKQSGPLKVDASEVLKEVTKLSHQPVLYLNQHLDIDMGTEFVASQAYELFNAQCKALSTRRGRKA